MFFFPLGGESTREMGQGDPNGSFEYVRLLALREERGVIFMLGYLNGGRG